MPDSWRRQLEERAAAAGMSLREYLLDESRRIPQRLSVEEMRARLRQRPVTVLSESPADLVRAERDAR